MQALHASRRLRPLRSVPVSGRAHLTRFYSKSSPKTPPPTTLTPPTTTTTTSTPPPPPPGPKPNIDLRHIRQNPDLYAANCTLRNYPKLSSAPNRIVELFGQWQTSQKDGRTLREEANAVRRKLANAPVAREVEEEAAGAEEAKHGDTAPPPSRQELLEEARALKQRLAAVEAREDAMTDEMQQLGAALPNLTSAVTPATEPTLLCYIGCEGRPSIEHDAWRSHVHVGAELGILDFAAASQASGWGWYYLLGDGARLEQALVQFALATAHRHGWMTTSPPSLVRSTIASACGFQPRDQGGEQQIYSLEGMPMSLTATAEIPLAALYANQILDNAATQLPRRRAAVSRCYRAEAGARGANTKGLYRVHEFTKVELFAWTAPDLAEATEVFDELVDMQTDILTSLGLPCRVLEMPATDLGASAYRKIDIEAFFPSRAVQKNDAGAEEKTGADKKSDAALAAEDQKEDETGWGEVTSASICTDYQTRRLATRARPQAGATSTIYPWTLNGTALAVPRVLAALLEHGWDENSKTVAIPACLQPWMDGQERIGVNRL